MASKKLQGDLGDWEGEHPNQYTEYNIEFGEFKISSIQLYIDLAVINDVTKEGISPIKVACL